MQDFGEKQPAIYEPLKKQKQLNPVLLIIIGGLLFIALYSLMHLVVMQQDLSDMRNNIISLSRDMEIVGLKNSNDTGIITERTMPIVAVSGSGEGVVSNLSIKVIPGEDLVLVSTNPFLETDLQYSVNTAVEVAKKRTEFAYDKDFIFRYNADSFLIGGGSAGAATAILAIAAIDRKLIKPGTIITGTIEPDGSIGKVGGVYEKAKAAADAGFKYFLVPKGQTLVSKSDAESTLFGPGLLINSIQHQDAINLVEAGKQWGIKVVEVSTIDDALPYFIDEAQS